MVWGRLTLLDTRNARYRRRIGRAGKSGFGTSTLVRRRRSESPLLLPPPPLSRVRALALYSEGLILVCWGVVVLAFSVLSVTATSGGGFRPGPLVSGSGKVDDGDVAQVRSCVPFGARARASETPETAAIPTDWLAMKYSSCSFPLEWRRPI
jgi:hypothetical protein